MKIAFISNFLNHHQLEFCQEMCKTPDVEFTFIATTPVPAERLSLGYEDMNNSYDFVLKSYESEEAYNRALSISTNYDIVITGSAPKGLTKKRVADNKITFRYMERILKGGRHTILKPRILASLILNHAIHRKKNVYLLCASAYTASDFFMVGAYKDKAYKWGYFPTTENYNVDNLMNRKNNQTKMNILWVGRFLPLKHPLMAIELIRRLVEQGFHNLSLTFIGEGPLLTEMKSLVRDYRLEDYVVIIKPMSPEKVREFMLDSNIFLFTSDLNEGWGAVLNEAMNSGCAVVASHAIGAVHFLIEDSKNGLIFESENMNSLESKVLKLLNNHELICKLGRNAYQTISETWNANKATTNLILLFRSLLKGEEVVINEGPVSKAVWISEKYHKGIEQGEEYVRKKQ